jgi:catechol 2,3-dioxygenase
MTGTQRIEHALLRVGDLDAATSFYTDVLGLVELDREEGTAYLGCGLDERYDLAVTEGGSGVDHVAIRVDGGEELDTYGRRLTDRGVATERTHAEDDRFGRGMRFSLPSGVGIELLTVEDSAYRHVTHPRGERAGVAPMDLDHVTLTSDRLEEDVEFLESTLDFRLSEVHEREEGGWRFAWTRFGTQHHDVAFVRSDDSEYTLHHLAFTMSSVDHMKRLIDHMAGAGFPIEVGVNRHEVGSNVFCYFGEPGGNRFELSAEMATLDDATPTRVNGPDVDTLTAWGGITAPETFAEGS